MKRQNHQGERFEARSSKSFYEGSVMESESLQHFKTQLQRKVELREQLIQAFVLGLILLLACILITP